jgi:hypothetical protein
MESSNISCYKRSYQYSDHLLTPWFYDLARSAFPFTTEADYCYFTLCENIFFREFLYFSNLYLETTVSSVILNGINVASTLQVCAPSILILLFGGKLRSTKAEVTSQARQMMFSFRYKMRKKVQADNKNISTVSQNLHDK